MPDAALAAPACRARPQLSLTYDTMPRYHDQMSSLDCATGGARAGGGRVVHPRHGTELIHY